MHSFLGKGLIIAVHQSSGKVQLTIDLLTMLVMVLIHPGNCEINCNMSRLTPSTPTASDRNDWSVFNTCESIVVFRENVCEPKRWVLK